MQYKWTVLTVTTIGTLLAGLDSRIVIVGLPTIANQLKAGPEELVWISQSYLLASTICLLLIGRLADIFGRIKLYNLGFLVFTIGSGLSAISFDPFQLISFRIIQGLGAGMILANSAAIVTDSSPPKELGMMIGINQTALRVGSIAGLTLSGIILSITDWRGLFYINIPIGIFGTIWAYLRLRDVSTKDRSKKIDWFGLLFFSIGLTLVLLSVTYLSYGSSGEVDGIFFLFVGFLLLAIFVRQEASTPSPLLDLRLFKIRLFAGGNSAQLLNSLVWSGLLVLVTFYLQIGLGYSALTAGLGLLPLEGAYVIASLISSKLSDIYGTRVLCTTGLVLIVTGLMIISTFGMATSYLEIALALAVIGIGNGMFTPPNLRAIMGSVPENRRGIASGFRQTMFNTGLTSGYGLVVLFLTFGISYVSLAPLIQGIGGSSALLVARSEFFDGFRIAALLFGVIDAVAILPSAMRGRAEIRQLQH